MNNTKLIIAYYVIGASALIGQAVFTLYQSSQVIHYGQEVAQMERQRHELEAKQQQLREQIAQVSSLSQVANSDQIQDFTLASTIVTVTDSNVVAAR